MPLVAVVVVLATVGPTNATTRPDACALITNSEASHILGARVTSSRTASLASCNLSFHVAGSGRPGWLVPNVNPTRPGTLCCSAQGALRRFRSYGAKITMISELGAGAFAAEVKTHNGSLYEQIIAGRHGSLFVLQSERRAASVAQMVALAVVAYQRL